MKYVIILGIAILVLVTVFIIKIVDFIKKIAETRRKFK